MTTMTAVSRVGELVLARLLAVGKRPPTPGRLRSEIERFLRQKPSSEQWQAQLDELVGAGLLAIKPYRLTETGKARALEFIGVEALPARANWGTIQAGYLVPKALGVPVDAEDTRKRIKSEDGLAALLVKREYDVPVGGAPTLARVLQALAVQEACKRMGVAPTSSWEGLEATLLGEVLGQGGLDRKQLDKQLPRKVVGAHKSGIAGLREAVLQNWLGGDRAPAVRPDRTEPAAETAPFDLAAFAGTVQAVARHCPHGWFGTNKVFISHVWRATSQEPGFPQMTLAEFKARLTEANNQGLLRLSRADLVEAMNPADVQESETPYLNAVFHFVLVEKEQS